MNKPNKPNKPDRPFRAFFRTGALVLCAAALIGLSGCSPVSKEEKLQQETSRLTSGLTAGYHSTMEIQYGDIKATASINQQFPGNYKISFTEPAVMSGMEFETEGDLIKIRYHDLSTQFTADEFFNSSVASMVVSSLNAVTSQEGMSIELKDECLSITGEKLGSGSTGEFVVKIDRKNGNLMRLDYPERNFSVEFKDFQFLSGE